MKHLRDSAETFFHFRTFSNATGSSLDALRKLNHEIFDHIADSIFSLYLSVSWRCNMVDLFIPRENTVFL